MHPIQTCGPSVAYLASSSRQGQSSSATNCPPSIQKRPSKPISLRRFSAYLDWSLVQISFRTAVHGTLTLCKLTGLAFFFFLFFFFFFFFFFPLFFFFFYKKLLLSFFFFPFRPSLSLTEKDWPLVTSLPEYPQMMAHFCTPAL